MVEGIEVAQRFISDIIAKKIPPSHKEGTSVFNTEEKTNYVSL